MIIKNQYNFLRKKSIKNYILLINEHLLFSLIFIFITQFTLSYENSEIKIIISGRGTKNFLYNSFYKSPSEVTINNDSKSSGIKSFNFNEDLNEIAIKFDSQIESCENMFYGLKSIKEIDLSNFDTSFVTSMEQMFKHCESVTKIDVSRFNTSMVESMLDMFADCYQLSSINVSSFDTSKVKNMQGIFYRCYSLLSLDLSNFLASSIETIQGMFENNGSLMKINLYSFKIKYTTNINYIFGNTSSHLKICINDLETRIILDLPESQFDCSDFCLEKNLKIDIKYNRCVENCNESEFKFEYNNSCNEKCPSGTYNIENEYLCLDEIPEGYYLNSSKSVYKKCYETCKRCNGQGDIINNNCIECLNNHDFLNDSIHKNNCYEKCNYYYYFNESNYHICTNKNECPSEYNKLIPEKKKCIDDCKKDEAYIYKYNSTCLLQCPNWTMVNETNKVCYDKEKINKETDGIYKSEINNDKSNIFSSDEIKLEEEKNINNYRELIIKSDIIENITKTKNDLIRKENNITYLITTSENQKNNKNNNISTINLGTCEKILRDKYQINEALPLIIFKIDYFPPDTLIPIIGYEIYHPITKSKLDLTFCKDILVKLNIPVSIDEKNLFKYEPNSNFYTDNCFPYSTENGTDIILNDRKQEFIDNNLSLCENNCEYIGYNTDNKQSSCDCAIKNKMDLISEILFTTI